MPYDPSVAAFNNSSDTVRLNRALSRAGVCSRRKADELIQSGQVRVNGQTVTELGTKIVPGKDKVEVQGRFVPMDPVGHKQHLTVLLHKPIHVITTASDPQGRTTVFNLLPKSWKHRGLFPVGRLDFMSEGLLLLTTDGDLAHRLTHPKYHLPKFYEVRIRGGIEDDQLAAIQKGMRLSTGEKLAPVQVRIQRSEAGGTTVLSLRLIQGVNRQIRRMCEDLGLTILQLKRTRLGSVSLGQLPPGKSRELSRRELSELKKQVGL